MSDNDRLLTDNFILQEFFPEIGRYVKAEQCTPPANIQHIRNLLAKAEPLIRADERAKTLKEVEAKIIKLNSKIKRLEDEVRVSRYDSDPNIYH